METNVERIMELKAQAEAGIKMFHEAAREITAMGFNLQSQENLTVYIYKNNIEAYGELYKHPVAQQQNVLNGDLRIVKKETENAVN